MVAPQKQKTIETSLHTLGTLKRVQLSKRKVEKAITTTFLRASTQKKLIVEKKNQLQRAQKRQL